MGVFIDLTGKRFGRLIVIRRIENDKNCNSRWLCKCGCGKVRKINGNNLRSRTTKSCGCLQKEKLKSVHRLNIKHGHAKRGKESKTYISWGDMVQRCTNKNHKHYRHYGGRGIAICNRWNPKKGGSFKNFLRDMGERQKGKTIDRINNNKGYSPKNCKWSTMKEQNRNKRNSKK